MKKRFFAILSSFLFLFAFISCNNLISSSTGSIEVSLPAGKNRTRAAASSQDVSLYVLKLYKSGTENSGEPVSVVNAAAGTSASIANISEGTYTLKVYAYTDASSALSIGYGVTENISVIPGQITEAAVSIHSNKLSSISATFMGETYNKVHYDYIPTYSYSSKSETTGDGATGVAEPTETITSPLPYVKWFTFTKTYIDGTTETINSVSDMPTDYQGGSSTADGFTVAFDSANINGGSVPENIIGNIPIKITYSDESNTLSTVVNVPYKYTISEQCSFTNNYIAQYTGSTVLTYSGSTRHNLYDSSTKETTEVTDTVTSTSYQWYKSTSSTDSGTAIEGATNITYTLSGVETAGKLYFYCKLVNPTLGAAAWHVENITPAEITVTPWTMKLTKTGDTNASYTIAEGQSQTIDAIEYTIALLSGSETASTTISCTIGTTTSAIQTLNLTDGQTATISVTATVTLSETENKTYTIFTTTLTAKTVSSITAALKDSSHYETTSSTMAAPDISCFTITKTYADNTTATETPAEKSAAYTTALPSAVTSNVVGTIPVTITLALASDTSKTYTVNVPYKYSMVIPTITVSSDSSNIAQYTGSATLTATCADFTTYQIYSSTGEYMNLVDTVSYQWYSATSSTDTNGTAIDGATSASYTVSAQKTAGNVYYYCVATTGGNSAYCSNQQRVTYIIKRSCGNCSYTVATKTCCI